MIRFYDTAEAFLAENGAILDAYPYETAFFRPDVLAMKAPDRRNYAVRAENGGDVLLAVKVEPFNLLLFGAPSLAEPLFDTLMEGGYALSSLLAEITAGRAAAETLRKKYGILLEEALPMDFMEAVTVTEPTDPAVETASPSDAEEIIACMRCFRVDCGLQEEVDEERVREHSDTYRVLRQEGKIVSMVRIVPESSRSKRLTDVYTRPEYRGQHLARRVVNAAKNEVLSEGKVVTLNVDRRNPVSNHLYTSLGFVRLFSQSEYRLTK